MGSVTLRPEVCMFRMPAISCLGFFGCVKWGWWKWGLHLPFSCCQEVWDRAAWLVYLDVLVGEPVKRYAKPTGARPWGFSTSEHHLNQFPPTLFSLGSVLDQVFRTHQWWKEGRGGAEPAPFCQLLLGVFVLILEVLHPGPVLQDAGFQEAGPAPSFNRQLILFDNDRETASNYHIATCICPWLGSTIKVSLASEHSRGLPTSKRGCVPVTCLQVTSLALCHRTEFGIWV